MIRLNETDSRTLGIIKQWQEQYRNSPMISDIARELGRHYGTARHALYRLERKGYIDLIHIAKRTMIVPLYWE